MGGNSIKSMEIPLVKDFNSKIPIDIETNHGVVQLFPLHYKRGSGEEKWSLSIKGIVHTEVEAMEPCLVYFKGKELDGYFSMVAENNGHWSVTFETIIPIAEYWGESP
jgi:hypothetical protein